MISMALVRALAAALGLAPSAWSERQVLNVIRGAYLLGPRGVAPDAAADANRWREPGWVLLRATVVAKMARAPTMSFAGATRPAVEIAVILEQQADAMGIVLGHECTQAQREGRQLRGDSRIDALAHAMHRVLTDLARVRATRAYAEGIRYLGREFAWCARTDPAFRRWATDAEGA